MELPLKTTTLGAFPKPNYVPVRDWFDLARKTGRMNTAETTRQYSADIEDVRSRIKMIQRVEAIPRPSYGIYKPLHGHNLASPEPIETEPDMRDWQDRRQIRMSNIMKCSVLDTYPITMPAFEPPVAVK